MKSVSTILLAVDGEFDDRSLVAEAELIAGDAATRVTIMSITAPPSGSTDKNDAMSDLQKQEEAARSAQVEELSELLSSKGLQVEVQHAVGKPYLEIIRETLNNAYNLVLKPARHDSGIRQILLSGTDFQLLSLCPIPVWLFQATASRTLKKIAVAVDLQPDDPEKQALADKVLGWGKFVARSAGAELHVVHVWSIYRENALRARTALTDVVDDLADGKERLHRKWLYDAVQKAGLGNDEIVDHVAKGSARQLIPQLVDELKIDLLVMGTVGRTGIPGFFIGNTADSVLRNVGCSVLAIKPDKFTTPVEPVS